MTDISQQLKRINEKLQQVLKNNQLLLKENERLGAELQLAKDTSAGHLKQVDELQQKISLLKLATGQMLETDKKELEKRLNLYIREIDRCITMLGE
jgi:predicted nuclease with TOPRIM domain